VTVRLSVVVPAFHEERRIAATVTSLREALAPLEGATEIIVVDDGSADATAACARAAGADRVIRLPVNRGKGAAVRAGVLASVGRAVAFTDADLSYSPDQLLRLLDRLEGGADVVVGSRRVEGASVVAGPGAGSRRAASLREISSRAFNVVTRLILRGVLENTYSDTQCGLKAFSGEAGRFLLGLGRIDRFAFDVELLCLAERNGFDVREVPVELTGAEGSTVRVGTDALRMVADLFRLRRWVRAGAYDTGRLPAR